MEALSQGFVGSFPEVISRIIAIFVIFWLYNDLRSRGRDRYIQPHESRQRTVLIII